MKTNYLNDPVVDLCTSLELLLSYTEKYDYYDKLLLNENGDKYIMCSHYVQKRGKELKNVTVFRKSQITDRELIKRLPMLDDDRPLIHCDDHNVTVYSYLSDIKMLTDNVYSNVVQIMKGR